MHLDILAWGKFLFIRGWAESLKKPVLVSAGTELVFFPVVAELGFGFKMRILSATLLCRSVLPSAE